MGKFLNLLTAVTLCFVTIFETSIANNHKQNQVLTKASFEQLSFQYRKSSSSEDIYEGPVQVIISDDFEKQKTDTKKFIRDPNGLGWLELSGAAADKLLQSQSHVRLSGEMQAQSFVTSEVEVLEQVQSSSFNSKTVRSIIMARINFTGSLNRNAQATTQEIVAHLDRTNEVYRYGSWNRVQFDYDIGKDGTPDIYDVILPFNGGCGVANIFGAQGGWVPMAKAALINQGIDVSVYDHFSVLTPELRDFCGGLGGIANVGSIESNMQLESAMIWLFGEPGHSSVIPHELGHNLGMYHAQDESNGTLIEYGDDSSIMGNGRRTVSLNSVHAEQMEGFNAYDDKMLIATEGSFSISALGIFPPHASHSQIVKFPFDHPDPEEEDYNYNISLRVVPDILESNIPLRFHNKVSIHKEILNASGSPASRLVAILDEGQTFSDAAANISIMVERINTLSKTADVSLIRTIPDPTQNLVNQKPISKNQNLIVKNQEKSFFKLSLVDPSDLNHPEAKYSIVVQPKHGKIEQSAGGLWTYEQNDKSFVGMDQFTWMADDGEFQSEEATVSIFILPDGKRASFLSSPRLELTQQSDAQVSFGFSQENPEDIATCKIAFGDGNETPCAETIEHHYTSMANTQACAITEDTLGEVSLACADVTLSIEEAGVAGAANFVTSNMSCRSASANDSQNLLFILFLIFSQQLALRRLKEK